MEILNLQILRGPNYWSNTHTRLMVIKLDLLHYETHQSNSIQGFTQALERLLPSLATHPCTDNGAGGFLKRLQEGAPLSYVIEHLAQELQCLVGMKCSFGRTRALGKKASIKLFLVMRLNKRVTMRRKLQYQLLNA